MTAPLNSLHNFGHEHFAAAQLGDQRRTDSLVDLGSRFAQHPGGTLPDQCKNPNALRRCYDLMNCPAVTHERVLRPHVQRTRQLVLQHHGVVLLLHDTTALDFTGLKSLHDELGQIGSGYHRGYLCHNSLAVLPATRQVVGLVHQILHVRPESLIGEPLPQRRERESRESLLWVKAVAGVADAMARCRRRLRQPVAADAVVCVDVCDRGADTFEFLDEEDRLGRSFVISSRQDRSSQLGHDTEGAAGLLHGLLRTLPAQGQRSLDLPARDGRPARGTTVQIAWAALTVPVPGQQRGHYRGRPLRLWAIRVWGAAAPPAGAEAVEWFLLTDRAVATPAAAWERVDWYTCRRVVEEYHKSQKTGCDIESPQFTTAAALQPMIALLSVVAVLLLNLRDRSRDAATQGEPAAAAVDEEYVEVLSGWRYHEGRPLTVREFFQALARLGGHQNRKGDGAPGWLVLWRGWSALQLLVAGARALRHGQASRRAAADAGAATTQPPPDSS